MAEVVQVQQAATDKPPLYFSDDILIEIFLCLPARSLLLLRSVCKHWLSIIQSTNFIHLHLNRPIYNHNDRNPMLIIRSIKTESQPKTQISKFYTQKIVLTLLSDDETLAYKVDVPLEIVSHSITSRRLGSKRRSLDLLGPCNGLFCITNTIDVVIFNPATRECREVPHNPLSPQGRSWHFGRVLFGFDPISNDYKIVRFYEINVQNLDGNYNYNDGPIVCKIEIFSLSTNLWRELDHVLPADNISRLHRYSVFLNGALHLLKDDEGLGICSIQVFDLNKESFKQFELPDSFIANDNRPIYLSILDESLALILLGDFDPILYDRFEIWVMKEYRACMSWSKLNDIHVGVDIQRPLSFGKDGEFLLENRDGQLVSFNLNTREIKELEVHGLPLYAFRYRESLVSMGR